MDDAQAKALRAPIPEDEIGKLPRVWCQACRKSDKKVCAEHKKAKCNVCSNNITTAHLHLDYFGHAETTDRLLAVDPEWSWEPVAWGADGLPVVARHGPNLVMWAKLTVAGVTRLGVGTCGADKDDAHKELIGDFLRNAAMRFGVALDLWRKSERAVEDVEQEPPPTASPDQLRAIATLTRKLTPEQRAEVIDGRKVMDVELKAEDNRILATPEQAEAVIKAVSALVKENEAKPDPMQSGSPPPRDDQYPPAEDLSRPFTDDEPEQEALV
jgi:hypothetical protein